MQVREIMTPNPACCTPDSTLQEVALLMREKDCGCIPVVNSYTDMKPIGTITDRDITIRTVADNQNPVIMKASDIMTADIATVTPETSLEYCFDLMEDREIRRVLIIDERGKICGIVAQADIVQSAGNAVRTNRVIRAISESAPSPHQPAPRGRRNYKSLPRKQSFLGGGSLLPLLIGAGTGVALLYLLNNHQKSTRRAYVGDISRTGESDFLNAGDHENFAKYVGAEHEIEEGRERLNDRDKSVAKKKNPPVKGGGLIDEEDETVVSLDKARSARQGKS